MTRSNCWLYALKMRKDLGGSIVIRRSLKSWVLHAFHVGPRDIGRTMHAANPIGWGRGLLKIMGPERGYLVWTPGMRLWWYPNINNMRVSEYVPPDWVDKLSKAWWIVRTFPLHVVLFKGTERYGQGESPAARMLMAERAAGV